MKIVLFRDGQPGVVAKLPGEDPTAELADLLGGEIEMTQMNERMRLVTLKDGEEREPQVRYAMHGLGREPRPIAGDCAVVAVKPDGMLRDVSNMEVIAAEACVQCVR